MSLPPESPLDLLMGPPRYDASEIAALAGMDFATARRIWRAMGFAEPPDDEAFFTDSDLEALTTAQAFLEGGHADLELTLAMARVLSQSLALAAGAQVDAIGQRVQTLEQIPAELDVPVVVKGLETVILHIWRRHLAAALQNEIVPTDTDADTSISTIGFADLVGFTRLSRHVDDAELTRIVELFDSRTQEIVSELGGRIVKTIGDEVMFFMRDTPAGAEAALRMAEAFPDDGAPPTVRVGLATGPVIKHRGDFYGPTVNLASRAVGEARPGTVLVSAETQVGLQDDPAHIFKPIRPRHLKGIGPTPLWVLRRPGRT